MKKKNSDLEDLEKFEKIGDKAMEIISSIGMSAATTSLLSLIFGTMDSPYNIAFLTGGTVLTSPFMYLGMKKLKNKLDDRVNRDMHFAGQICVMLQDAKEKDRHIGNMTSLFLDEILEVFEKDNKDFKEDDLMKINQFIYLVNCNYYEKINTLRPTLTRENLVQRLVKAISVYLNEQHQSTFDDKDVPNILKRCFFIPEDLQAEISKEFKQSKVKILSKTDYAIIRNDTKGDASEYMAKKEEETKDLYLDFDLNDIMSYRGLIDSIEKSEKFMDMELGDPRTLTWDFEFLMTTMQTIGNGQRERLQQINGYSNFWMVFDFIYEATTYALVNNRTQVGRKEILSTFKYWDYIPFDIQLDALDDLFRQEGIDYSEHPYQISGPRNKKPYQKIIPFKLPNNKTD